MDRLEFGDVLIVTKLNRLGRDAIDVSTTVKKLAGIGVQFTASRLAASIWQVRPER
jgi:DNA invertase Pin-like site-specific DNA recombinase